MARITVIGNATRDFEVYPTGSGGTLGKVGIAENRRWTDGAGKQQEATSFYDVVVLNSEEAEHYASWIRSGQRLMVQGDLRTSTYETDDGEKRTKVEIANAEIGASGRWALVTVEKLERSGDGGQAQQTQRGSAGARGQRGGQSGGARRAPARANAAASSPY